MLGKLGPGLADPTVTSEACVLLKRQLLRQMDHFEVGQIVA